MTRQPVQRVDSQLTGKSLGLVMTHLLPRRVLEFYPDVHSSRSLQSRIQGFDMITGIVVVGLN